MGFYLLQAAYTPEKWAEMISNPAFGVCEFTTRPAIEQKGGRFVNGFLAFGEYDIVVLYEVPDNLSAAAVSMTLAKAGGPFKAIKTTPLITTEDARAALNKAK